MLHKYIWRWCNLRRKCVQLVINNNHTNIDTNGVLALRLQSDCSVGPFRNVCHFLLLFIYNVFNTWYVSNKMYSIHIFIKKKTVMICSQFWNRVDKTNTLSWTAPRHEGWGPKHSVYSESNPQSWSKDRQNHKPAKQSRQ